MAVNWYDETCIHIIQRESKPISHMLLPVKTKERGSRAIRLHYCC